MEELLRQLDVIRRWKYLVLAIALIAAAAALLLSLSGGSSYTARATMFVGSSTSGAARAPEQNAVLTRGYAEYLNSPVNQVPLRQAAGVPDDITIATIPVASSPIFYIEATGPRSDEAIRSATAFANAFETSVGSTFEAQFNRRVEPLRRLLADNTTQIASTEQRLNTENLPANLRVELQGRLETLRTERQSLLGQLSEIRGASASPDLVTVFEEAATATENAPNVFGNVLLGLIGGLILGCAVAVVLGALQLRISSPELVRARLNLPTLATVATGDPRRRSEDLRALSNGISLMAGEPRVLAVTSATPNEGKSMVASNIARNRASTGDRVILIDANLRDRAAANGATNGRVPGLSGLLTGSDGRIEENLMDSGVANMLILPAGSASNDPYSLMSEERLRRVLERVTPLADLVVVDTPSLLSAAESQVVCSVADQTILVVDSANTHTSAAVEARDVLERIHARVLGVVLTRVSKRRGQR